MKINVEMEQCKFIVKPEDRKIICIYHCDPYCAQNYLFDLLRNSADCVFAAGKTQKMRRYYTGVATCAPEDEWDEEKGKLIAFTKMKEKFCSSFFKRVNYYFSAIDKNLEAAANACDRMGEGWNKHLSILEEKIKNM